MIFMVSLNQWFRFSEYEIRRGYLVPKAEAVLESYDPWKLYKESREPRPTKGAKRHESAPPYAALCNLVPQLASTLQTIDDPSSGYWPHTLDPGPDWDGDSYHVLTEEAENALLNWCREYGLLGILPHCAHQITLAPLGAIKPWADTETRDGVIVRDESARTLVLSSRMHQRIGGDWSRVFWEIGEFTDRTDVDIIDRLLRDGVLTAKSPNVERSEEGPAFGCGRGTWGIIGLTDQPFVSGSIPSRYFNDLHPIVRPGLPGVAWQDILSGEWHIRSFDSNWRRYFPSVPTDQVETFSYPQPLTEEFWQVYAEPVHDFVRVANYVRDMIQNLRLIPEDPWVIIGGDRRWHGLDTLNRLLASSAPHAVLDQSCAFRQTWQFPSLIGSFAMMVLQDLTEDRAIRTCESCGALFLSSAYQAKFCSSRCRHREQKRRQRSGEQK